MMKRLSKHLSPSNSVKSGSSTSDPQSPIVDAAATSQERTLPWPGYNGLKNLFIFGDSYSAIGFAANDPPPSIVDRKSIPYQGDTYADPDGTNWVGYLLMQHNPHPQLLVHDYAVGGARVPAVGWGGGVETQINKNFLEGYAMKRTQDGSLPWDAADSLFVTWVGINDCAFAQTHTETMKILFNLQEKLYNAGARIFLFIDVPPIARTPAASRSSDISETYMNWNASLSSHVQDFASAHPDARVLSFSAFDSFNHLLDSPEFSKKDVRTAGGKVWRDHLHPTSRVHEIFAGDLVRFLKSVDEEV